MATAVLLFGIQTGPYAGIVPERVRNAAEESRICNQPGCIAVRNPDGSLYWDCPGEGEAVLRMRVIKGVALGLIRLLRRFVG